jgi:hypothetical protein
VDPDRLRDPNRLAERRASEYARAILGKARDLFPQLTEVELISSRLFGGRGAGGEGALS